MLSRTSTGTSTTSTIGTRIRPGRRQESRTLIGTGTSRYGTNTPTTRTSTTGTPIIEGPIAHGSDIPGRLTRQVDCDTFPGESPQW